AGAKHNDFLESKGCFAHTPSGRRVSPSSSVETDLDIREPSGLPGMSPQMDTTTDLDQKSSSSHSDHTSEILLPDVQKEKYPEEFSLLKMQTKDGQRPEWTFYPRFSSNIHTYHVGKQCFFNGVFLGNRRSLSERTVDKCFGRKKYVLSVYTAEQGESSVTINHEFWGLPSIQRSKRLEDQVGTKAIPKQAVIQSN
ncbi:Spermatogenesis-associated serine-rich protein 1, partial [Tupaia chinensis]